MFVLGTVAFNLLIAVLCIAQKLGRDQLVGTLGFLFDLIHCQ